MRKVIDDPRLIYKCCKLYYEESASQQEIANQMKLSRVSVCRMLKAGREQGMVVIQVHSPNRIEYGRLERQLEEYYGLKEALVVENSPRIARYDQTTTVGVAANRLFETYLAKGDIVGVSSGRLLYGVCCSPRLGAGPMKCTFVPIIGGLNTSKCVAPGFNATQIAEKFAQIFGGAYMECFAPAVFSDNILCKKFMDEPAMRSLHELYGKMRTAILQIGLAEPAVELLAECGCLHGEERQRLSDAVGEIMLQFYGSDGSTEKYKAFNDRVASMALEDLCKLENRIGISSGGQTAKAVYSALQGGYVNILVTDEECAMHLIEMKKDK